MSKLDDIINDLCSDGPLESWPEGQAEDKQAIKDLMLELIGKDNHLDEIREFHARNVLRAELRKKVEEL